MDEASLLCQTFSDLGFEVLHYLGNSNINGPDAWVRKPKGRPMSVEIKKARKLKNKCWVVDTVSKPRRSDDFIAISCGPNYMLVESMEDHLKCCSKSGQRQLTKLMGENP